MNDEMSFKVLVVDDEESSLYILDRILSPEYMVYTAKSGGEALDAAYKYNPDIILLDVVMPEMDGFETLAELKDDRVTRNIPVIFITSLNDEEDERKGLSLGAVDYITKPFNHSIVKARVQTHLKIVKQMRKIERLGLVDALTEIPNRHSFNSQMAVEWGRAMREKSPVSLLIIDIDRFKHYNDTYGHPVGDALLKEAVKVFAHSLKRATDLVFRWGGDEFAVILPNTDLSGALVVAESIRAGSEAMMIANPCGGPDIAMTMSIGAAAAHPVGGSQIANFISEADRALYSAKAAGRNKVCAGAMC